VWPEGLCQRKIPVTPSGIEPVTLRLAAFPTSSQIKIFLCTAMGLGTLNALAVLSTGGQLINSKLAFNQNITDVFSRTETAE
jgi:hypothetical protein